MIFLIQIALYRTTDLPSVLFIKVIILIKYQIRIVEQYAHIYIKMKKKMRVLQISLIKIVKKIFGVMKNVDV